MKDGEAVAKSDGDVAPNLAVSQFENAVGRQGGVPFGQRFKAPVQIGKGLVGEDAVDLSQGPLLDGEQFVCAGDGLGGDIVHKGHQQVQLRLLPEILSLVGI